jgi:hypothetical protein
MGGVGDFLFGKKGKGGKSESGNHAWDAIEDSLTPALGYVTNAGNTAWDLLKGGPQGFADSGGMQFLMDTMQKGVTSSKSAQGLLKSGSYGTALQDRAMGLGSTYLNQYMDQLFKLGNLGLGSAGAMAGAGQWSKGTGATQGKQGALPGLISAAASIPGISDRELKTNIEFIEQRADGLNLYKFNYRQDAPIRLPKGTFVGVMAQEVAELRPELLDEPVAGYLTVKPMLAPERID